MYQQQIQMQPTTSMSAHNMLMQTDQPGYTEEFFQANSGDEMGDLAASEHYIYVTYPPELKRRLIERYGKEIYLLLKKDMYDYWKIPESLTHI